MITPDCFASDHIYLELFAALMGVISVWLSKKEHIGVFPTGIISTGIYTYICHIYELRGDMVINGYYFLMSIYGWYYWLRPATNGVDGAIAISRTNKREQFWIVVSFFAAIGFVFGVYHLFGTKLTKVAYADAFTTAVFFIAMWLMARKKIENWIFWIVGNVISIPLYFYKNLCFTGVQYIIFLVLAIIGYMAWKQKLTAKPIK